MDSDLVTVQTFSSEMEAHLAQTKLGTEGIRSTVHRFSRYRAMTSGGYLLKVPPGDAMRARSILGKAAAPLDMDEYVSSDDESYRRCPNCNSVNVVAAPLRRPTLLLGLMGLGIPLLFVRRDWHCAECHHAWRA